MVKVAFLAAVVGVVGSRAPTDFGTFNKAGVWPHCDVMSLQLLASWMYCYIPSSMRMTWWQTALNGCRMTAAPAGRPVLLTREHKLLLIQPNCTVPPT